MKIINDFSAEINGEIVSIQSIYNATEFLHEAYQRETGKYLSEPTLKAIYDNIYRWYHKYNLISIDELESTSSIRSFDSGTLIIASEDSDDFFDEINKIILMERGD